MILHTSYGDDILIRSIAVDFGAVERRCFLEIAIS